MRLVKKCSLTTLRVRRLLPRIRVDEREPRLHNQQGVFGFRIAHHVKRVSPDARSLLRQLPSYKDVRGTFRACAATRRTVAGRIGNGCGGQDGQFGPETEPRRRETGPRGPKTEQRSSGTGAAGSDRERPGPETERSGAVPRRACQGTSRPRARRSRSCAVLTRIGVGTARTREGP